LFGRAMIKGMRGQIALPFVLLVGGIIAEIVIAGSVVAFFASASSVGEQLALRSLSAAYAGVYDGILKVSGNKETAAAGDVNYTVTSGSDSANVIISRTTDDASDSYVFTITATASARTRRRKVVASLTANQVTGVVRIISVTEQAL